MDLFIEILILVLLIFVNAFFAASEIALISLNDNKVKIMAENGHKKAVLLRKLLEEPSKFLATIQIGITLAGFLASAYAADTFANRLVDWAVDAGIKVPQQIMHAVALVFITLILSYFTLVFGELVPKRLAMQKYEKISMAAVTPLHAIAFIASPFVNFLTMSTNFFVKLFGGDPEHTEDIITEEEIRMMVDAGEESGTIQEMEKEVINNIFDFDDKVASEIMTHRTEVVGLPLDSELKHVLTVVNREKYTRLPVYEDSLDDIVGILHVKDLFSYLATKPDKQFNLSELIRKPYFVPESKKTGSLFKELQMSKTHMAVVIDEYGGTAGIVTIEDLIEEIVGNIFDEYDEEIKEYEKIDDSTFLFDGSVRLERVEELASVPMPVDEYETLSGFVIGQLGRIPNAGEHLVLELDDYLLKVEAVDEKRISKIKLCKT
jgi:putative hemolysin